MPLLSLLQNTFYVICLIVVIYEIQLLYRGVFVCIRSSW